MRRTFICGCRKILSFLKNKEYDLVDWENLLEEIEDMGQRYLDSVVSFMAVILEHLYKWENFRYREYVGHSWIKSINNARNELEGIFERHPSVKEKVKKEESMPIRMAS
jgi:hypothetical protein